MQHITHRGAYTASAGMQAMQIDVGRIATLHCADTSKNEDGRAFTAAEMAETTGMLAQEIAYTVAGDALTTTVQGPAGEMQVVYTRGCRNTSRSKQKAGSWQRYSLC